MAFWTRGICDDDTPQFTICSSRHLPFHRASAYGRLYGTNPKTRNEARITQWVPGGTYGNPDGHARLLLLQPAMQVTLAASPFSLCGIVSLEAFCMELVISFSTWSSVSGCGSLIKSSLALYKAWIDGSSRRRRRSGRSFGARFLLLEKIFSTIFLAGKLSSITTTRWSDSNGWLCMG